ncbi:cyclic peptide export ABC transporter [Chitinophaga filiformis]|uniref:cyclic peptide export ABC transporter n=1 Tax=Chitinophaga filiformis TaxID=104663 RepID=UPI001F3FC86C|nr:cyclic peptide export ABC transporter [Chitinophaga filiformis]MCF6407813.1 cyclic peptide export ABC transporter [Chitinophaga filiformis]
MVLQHSDIPKRTIIFYTVLSGIVNAVLLSVLNAAANSAGEGEVQVKYLLLFALALTVFYITKRYILRKSVTIVENAVYSLRLRILEKLRHCELSPMESIGKDEIFTRVSNDTNFISQSAAVIINAFQALVLVTFALIYIGFLSFTAFAATIVILAIAISYFLRRQTAINHELRAANQNESAFYDHIENLIEGFKEIKINHLKNEQLFADITKTADYGKEVKTSSGLRFAVGFMFSEMVFYLLLASIIFLLPQFQTLYTGTLTRLTASILFVIGPLENIVTTIPLFAKAIQATQNIDHLERKIAAFAENENNTPKSHPPLPAFEEIKLENVVYDYMDEDRQSSFTLGPIDFTLKKGSLNCIIGGNGSGKSTFLKVLTNLYHPGSGRILVNGTELRNYDKEDYRFLFSTIFTDFHLFPKIYGIPKLDADKVNEYIKLMGLSHKTHFNGENFSNVRLSTGQRKRLALICTLLEDKPIMILDEVTADQDPGFKKFFYTEILPSFRLRGKTVIMVSHDDKYTEQFDRVIEMEYGKIISQ